MRTAVIGVGSMGKNHARILSQLSQLVAVSDSNESVGRQIASQYGCAYYKDYKEMLVREELEAVSVVVPTSKHREAALATIACGIPLLVEKPIANTLSDAREILWAARKARVSLMVGHIERFNRTLQEECLNKVAYNPVSFQKAINEYLPYYNNERLHLGINYLTPRECVQAIG